MIRTVQRILAVDPGFRSDGVLTLRLTAPTTSYPEPVDVAAFYQELLGRVRALPGVRAAGGTSTLALTSDLGVEASLAAMAHFPLLAESLRRRVDGLPDNMKMVVILRFQEDLKLSEIAEILDMPVNTVKTTLRRALARLREKAGSLQAEVCYGTIAR